MSELTHAELNEAAAVEVMGWSDNPGYPSQYYFSREWSATVEKEDWHPADDNAQALRVWLGAIEVIGDEAENAMQVIGGKCYASIDLMKGSTLAPNCDGKPVSQLAKVLTRCAVTAVREWRKQQETKDA